MTGTQEELGYVTLKAGVEHEVFVEFMNVRGPADGDEDETLLPGGPGVRLGGAELYEPEEALVTAENIAKEADVAIVVVGLNGDWESEGFDRKTLALPGRTDELVARVSAANPKTIVVCQSVSSRYMNRRESADNPAWHQGIGRHHALGQLRLFHPSSMVRW